MNMANYNSHHTGIARIFERLIHSSKNYLIYSLIQMKCPGGDKYVLPITVKFDQSTRKIGRITFARLFKLTKHNTLTVYLLSLKAGPRSAIGRAPDS